MPYILVFIGLTGFLGCVIWRIVNAIRWDSKKPPLIGMLVCFVLLIVGFVLVPSPVEQNKTDEKRSRETSWARKPEEHPKMRKMHPQNYHQMNLMGNVN